MEVLTIKTLKVYLYDKSSYRKKQILIGDVVAMGGNAMEAFQNGDIHLTFKITKKEKTYSKMLFQHTDELYRHNYAITLKMTAVDNAGKEEWFTGRNNNCVIVDYYNGLDGAECIKAIMKPSWDGESTLELFKK